MIARKHFIQPLAALLGFVSVHSWAQHAAAPVLPLGPVVASTVPANGDLNPYGVAFVPANFPGGALNAGDLLISNFNDKGNKPGRGTTLLRVQPNGTTSTFFQGTEPEGLNGGLAVLRKGFVIVGNLPSLDGTSATVQQGSLLVIDHKGALAATLTDAKLLNGPWELTVQDEGERALLFVSNALSGGVSRFELDLANGIALKNGVQIASGYTHKTDPAAFVVGPAGLLYDPHQDALYVTSSGDETIFRVANASRVTMDLGKGTVVFMDAMHLHGPLGLIRAPNGHLITANSDSVNADPKQPSELVEFTLAGEFVAQQSLDAANGGAFSLNITGAQANPFERFERFDRGGFERAAPAPVRIAAPNDNASTVTIWTLPSVPRD
jgi:hypothetical protein